MRVNAAALHKQETDCLRVAGFLMFLVAFGRVLSIALREHRQGWAK